MDKVTSFISKKIIPERDSHKLDSVPDSIFEMILNDIPEITKDSYISTEELNHYRKTYLKQLINRELGILNEREMEVVDAISQNKILSENIELEIEEKLTMGQKIADKTASFGGSWTFIIIFFSFLLIWFLINIWVLYDKPFDPYPFILLNLILSSLAAIQAPIIMMSQNRQDDKDRKRSEQDYKINLKAELEIKLLHEKMDHLIIDQNRRLLEIQELQADYLDDILNRIRK